MAGTNIGSPNNSPPRVIPDAGKVTNDGIEAEGNMPPNIFQHNESRSKIANGNAHGGPQVSVIFYPFSFARYRKWLARISSGENANRFNSGPDGSFYIAVVGNIRPVVGEDLRWRGVVLDVPCDRAAEGCNDAQIEAAIPGAQAPDPHDASTICRSLRANLRRTEHASQRQLL